MITRIAVALDGSRLSEKVLPFVSHLAKQLKAKVLLLHICLWPEDYSGDIYKEQESGILPFDYLKKVKSDLTDPDKPFSLLPEDIEMKVAYRKSTFELGDLARTEGADILVMTTHGRSGLSLLVMGSIANGVLKHTNMPVFIMRPDEKTRGEESQVVAGQPVPPIMVALDGSIGSEASLVPASRLCAQLNAPLYLVEVVTPLSPVIIASMGLGYGYANYDEVKEIQNLRKEATTYLERVKRNLQAANPLLRVEITVLVGDPALELTQYSNKLHPLFIAMATHARSELGQILLGSVTEELIRTSHKPVLLNRIPKEYHGYKRSLADDKTSAVTGSN